MLRGILLDRRVNVNIKCQIQENTGIGQIFTGIIVW